MTNALEMAVFFHETYERHAPSFGYATREDTKQFDPSSNNGRLMQAVCAEWLEKHNARMRDMESKVAKRDFSRQRIWQLEARIRALESALSTATYHWRGWMDDARGMHPLDCDDESRDDWVKCMALTPSIDLERLK